MNTHHPDRPRSKQADPADTPGRGPVQHRERRLPFLVAGAGLGLITVLLLVSAVVLPRITAPSVPVPGKQSVDVGFAQDMSIHHQQAVDMSIIVRDRTDDAEVRQLALDIINTQATQRGMMLGWLDLWDLPKMSSRPPMAWMGPPSARPSQSSMPGHEQREGALMPGMATDTQLDQLRAASGKQAEILYLQLLIPHHQSGITMAETAADNAETEPVRRLAQTMVEGQQAQIQLMTSLLQMRGATP